MLYSKMEVFMSKKLDPVKEVAELVNQNDYAYVKPAYSGCPVTTALMDHLGVSAIELTLIAHGCKSINNTYIVNDEQFTQIKDIVDKKDK